MIFKLSIASWDRSQDTGFGLHVCSNVIGSLCDAAKHSRCEIVNIYLVLLGNLFKMIDRPENFPYGLHPKVWEENVHNMISMG